MKGIRRVGGVIVLAPLAACMVGDEPRVVSADEPLPVDVVAGDVVRRGDVQLVVPEPGQEVSMIADFEDGSSVELAIRNPLGGAVEIIEPTAEVPDPLVIASGAPAACDDGAFTLSGHTWAGPYRWKFQAGSTPSANSQAGVEQGLQNAATAISTSRNSCGLADLVAITQTYQGRTSAAPGVRTQDTAVICGSADGSNVVGFGALPAGMLGVACSWTSNGVAVEGDIKLSTRNAWFALGVPSSCSNRFGVQAVSTHEFGHVFGLGHVTEASHPNLTMSTATPACSNSPLSLGLGDVRALRRLY